MVSVPLILMLPLVVEASVFVASFLACAVSACVLARFQLVLSAADICTAVFPVWLFKEAAEAFSSSCDWMLSVASFRLLSSSAVTVAPLRMLSSSADAVMPRFFRAAAAVVAPVPPLVTGTVGFVPAVICPCESTVTEV